MLLETERLLATAQSRTYSAAHGPAHRACRRRNLFIGERASLLGGAFTALADDASAGYYNPAGLVQSPGFTVSASWGGDKQNTLFQLFTLAQQHGMVWVGLGLAPGNNHSKGSTDDLNRTGASIGLMAQAHADLGVEGIGASEFRTAEQLGKRVAEAAQRWQAAPLAKAA